MQETNQTTPTIDLNALFTAALTQAINQATHHLHTRIAALEGQLSNITTTSDERIMAIAEEVAERCIYNAGYDANNIDDQINDAVSDAVRNLSFTVTVD